MIRTLTANKLTEKHFKIISQNVKKGIYFLSCSTLVVVKIHMNMFNNQAHGLNKVAVKSGKV